MPTLVILKVAGPEVDTATLAYSIRTEDEEDITCSLKDDILLAQMVLGTSSEPHENISKEYH